MRTFPLEHPDLLWLPCPRCGAPTPWPEHSPLARPLRFTCCGRSRQGARHFFPHWSASLANGPAFIKNLQTWPHGYEEYVAPEHFT